MTLSFKSSKVLPVKTLQHVRNIQLLNNKISDLFFCFVPQSLLEYPTVLYQQNSNILYSRKRAHSACVHSPRWWLDHYEAHFEGFCTCFSLQEKQLWHIKISQPYIRKRTHTSSNSRAVTQGQRRRFIFIMGKGAKSRWYEGGYINANCIGELLVLEKVCM